jgi:hypothetical protein
MPRGKRMGEDSELCAMIPLVRELVREHEEGELWPEHCATA